MTEPRYTLAEARRWLARLLLAVAERVEPSWDDVHFQIISDSGARDAMRAIRGPTGLAVQTPGPLVTTGQRAAAKRLLRARLLVAQLEREANA
jgi:hypothetical protein